LKFKIYNNKVSKCESKSHIG